MTEDRNPNAEWAYIFNTFGQDALREVLFGVAVALDEEDEPRNVVEFRNDDGEYRALEITDHINELES